MKGLFRNLVGCCFCWCLITNAVAQQRNYQKGDAFYQVDERKLVETKWQYTYTLHLESNTIIHRAEDTYDYFLFFRYNYTYQQYLNGQFSGGTWGLNGNDLLYRFKHIEKFSVASVNKKVLVLEFTQPNSRGTYQYHFVRVATEDSPFIKPPNELPDVNVEAINPNKSAKKWWVFNKPTKKKKRKKRTTPKANEPYISIEIIGGGFYGGINPTLRDYIHIKNDGRLIKEYKSRESGLVVTKRDIPRVELEKFAEYVMAQEFFDLERVYDCATELCQKRKKAKPAPIPLRLAIAYKDRRKVVTISIFGKDNHNIKYVDYPDELDQIIAAIQKMALRMNPS